ncbi:WG repeat-containing protein [Gelatiniphilus marinus]|uniref:WG repeat-containing protein n=1 Tax=Gelatiniphilus marinus TaxID=1759464 RepID=A0ABW5JN34_9FLAO
MKKVLFVLLIMPIFTIGQTNKALDFVSPIHDGLIAVKKNNAWGFINSKGVLVIDFRDDLVLTETQQGKYPVFKNNRCLISSKKKGIVYFGYIDKNGKTVIKPQFLNAFNFNNNSAMALKLIEEKVGKNEILGKNIVYHRYFEVVIDSNGMVKEYLNPKGVNVILDKNHVGIPPEITSKQISDSIYAVLNQNKKWTIALVN